MTSLYLVDDHQIMREGLRAMLEAKGHKVLGDSADVTQALADLQRLCPEVLLLDLKLGGRSGFEVLAELQRRSLPTRCVVLSMSAQPRDVAEVMRMGASAYVLKGSPGIELMNAIEAAAHGRRYLSAEVSSLALEVFMHPVSKHPLHKLSPRERQIITMVVNGQSSSEIGLTLHLSPKSVATYRSRLMAKLGVSNVTGLVRLAIERGMTGGEAPAVTGRRHDDPQPQQSLFTDTRRQELPTDAKPGDQ